jgi:class 3 adenylate cyclase
VVRHVSHDVGEEGLDVRVGIHAGDIERRNTHVSGIAVNIAARVMALVQPAELLTSETVNSSPPAPESNSKTEDTNSKACPAHGTYAPS